MEKTIAETNREIAHALSSNFARLLMEVGGDFDRCVLARLHQAGYADIRPAHQTVFANLGTGAVRVSELAERAQVTQQAMGKTLKELERRGYIVRSVDTHDKRAKAIELTDKGEAMAQFALRIQAQVRQEYAIKIGVEELDALEQQLRTALGKLRLNYLPETWIEHAAGANSPET
ncbi:MAG: MarR family transcriptional regulator [Halioglobus sp.]